MQIIIFEGIATSGKSTIIDKLKKTLHRVDIKVVGEDKTHEPIMQNTSDKNIYFFKTLVGKYISEAPDLLIFDRLYLTQAYRAKCTINDYSAIERLLEPYNTKTILLKVEESAIADRLLQATKHREKNWGKYVNTKGDNMDEVAEYYISQQRGLIDLLKASKLPYKIFGTTNHNYQEIVSEIIDELNIA